jgi:nucleoside-diphosphate-sugar epimerase
MIKSKTGKMEQKMKTVLVLGANGLFGSHAAQAFGQAGWNVRRYERGTDMNRAAMGTDVIVNGLNPPKYHNWAKLIPQITAQVIAAGLASGATVLVPGNVYVYGDQAAPWTPATPHRPVVAKGRIRAEMEAGYRQATTQGLRVIVLRGGDYMAPGHPGAVLNIVTLKSLAKGRLTAMGDVDAIRAYAYLPDMARTAVGLAERKATLPAFADVPFAGNAFSIAHLATALEGLMGRKLKIGQFPWWQLRLLSPFWELARELREMRYLYSTPHWLPEEPLQTLLPEFRATPFDTILRAHLAAMT